MSSIGWLDDFGTKTYSFWDALVETNPPGGQVTEYTKGYVLKNLEGFNAIIYKDDLSFEVIGPRVPYYGIRTEGLRRWFLNALSLYTKKRGGKPYVPR